MKKYYITNHIQYFSVEDIANLRDGAKIIFEMPSFCSGDYTGIIYKDDLGYYINAENNWFSGARGYKIV